VTDDVRAAEDESREFFDGTFFKRLRRSEFVLAGLVAGFLTAAIKTRGALRLVFGALALGLLGFFAWSAMVTSVALSVRRIAREHLPRQR